MNEGEIKVAEKSAFNGNLALLRVCAIMFIVIVFGYIANMFLVGRGELLVSLWSALTTSSFEDILATIGLFFTSGLLGLIGFGAIALVCTLALAIFALIKKNVIALKIVAVLVIALNFVIPSMLRSVAGGQNFGGIVTGVILNVNLVAAVAAFFVTSKKCAEEKKDVEVCESFNLGLYRFCSVCFLVVGLNGIARMVSLLVLGYLPVFDYVRVLPSIVTMLAGIFTLVKKNTIILMACSLLMFFQIIWGLFHLAHIGYVSENARTFMIAHAILNSIFNTTTVVCVAAFFVEPEWIKRYLQKAKE